MTTPDSKKDSKIAHHGGLAGEASISGSSPVTQIDQSKTGISSTTPGIGIADKVDKTFDQTSS